MVIRINMVIHSLLYEKIFGRLFVFPFHFGSVGPPFCNTRKNQSQHEGRERDEECCSRGGHLRGKILVDTKQEKACRGQNQKRRNCDECNCPSQTHHCPSQHSPLPFQQMQKGRSDIKDRRYDLHSFLPPYHSLAMIKPRPNAAILPTSGCRSISAVRSLMNCSFLVHASSSLC